MSLHGLRIALVGPAPPPAGGMAMQTLQLAGLLAAEGAQVQHVVSNAPCRPAWLGRVRGLRALARLLGFLVALWRALGRSDVVHLMANSGLNWHLVAMPTLLLGRLRAVPVVVNYRGGGAGEFLARGDVMVRRSMRWAARLIVPSGFLVEVFARHGMRADIVPNIIDLARFTRRPPRTAGSAHIVVARHLEALYDNATALRAFALVRAAWPAARLTIAGQGPERARLEALAAGLGVADAVHFAGGLPREAMAALFREADLSLNPSRADNMPNSVLEAMASGVPVVSSKVGGVPFIVQNGRTGLLVPVGDAPAMADALLALLRDPARWQSLADAGADEVRRYAWPQVRPLLEAAYRGGQAEGWQRVDRSVVS
jgi:glycosyltransferase involved in cell wall biosynthesis